MSCSKNKYNIVYHVRKAKLGPNFVIKQKKKSTGPHYTMSLLR